jgi:hypothetical protein
MHNAMSLFQPSKLTVAYMPPVTPLRPIEGRKYTLTHNNENSGMTLTIGTQFDSKTINEKIRDEVLAEWIPRNGEFHLYGKIYISNGDFDEKYAKVRYMIFQKELTQAIKAICYADQAFYSYFPWLLDSPIHFQFESNYSLYQQVKYYGTPRQYLTSIYKEPVIKTYST